MRTALSQFENYMFPADFSDGKFHNILEHFKENSKTNCILLKFKNLYSHHANSTSYIFSSYNKVVFLRKDPLCIASCLPTVYGLSGPRGFIQRCSNVFWERFLKIILCWETNCWIKNISVDNQYELQLLLY